MYNANAPDDAKNGASLTTPRTWHPSSLIDGQGLDDGLAVVLLNRPILLEKHYFTTLWNGGKNDYLYLTRQIVHTPDQNATDFTKSLKVLKSHGYDKHISRVLTLCESSGRLDQIMANINTLFLAETILPVVDVFLRSSNSLTWLVRPGEHSIDIPQRLVSERIWCSLVPIGQGCLCRTEGLKWNLDGSRSLQFGSIVSTSNTYSMNRVRITTDGPLLWSMGTTPKDM
uniref:Thiamin pyrophosphokinase thiamin-binding domain-containing protein n=1 Tax=Anopheles dirus TaxID=7168 RepID=A0A182NDW3_9DIPT